MIASTVSAIACIALIALWVRSYYYAEWTIIPGVRIWLSSFKGKMGFHARPDSPFPPFVRVEGIPYLLLVLLAGSLAALPWVRWSKRYSLRAMLIISTLIAVVLGMVAISK
jgi:hypothetical protein